MSEDNNRKVLSKPQRDKVAEYMGDRKKLQAAVAGALSKKKKSARARKLASGDTLVIKKGLLDLFAHLPMEKRLKARQLVCVEYDFCKSRRDTVAVLALIPAMYQVFSGQYSIPLCLIVALFIYKPLDILCECPRGEVDEFVRKAVMRLFRGN